VRMKGLMMADKQALAKARKLFGKNAHIEKRKGSAPESTHFVGCVVLGMLFSVHGHGRSWEEAFEQFAEKRARLS